MRSQHGQAFIELLVVAMAVLSLAWGGMWLFRWQQIKTQTQHHSALQAFRFSQSYLLKEKAQQVQPDYSHSLYSYSPHQVHSHQESLPFTTQWAPMRTAYADELIAAVGQWRFYSTATAVDGPLAAWAMAKAHVWPAMRVQSQLSIFVGAGHADHDEQATQRLAQHKSLWQSSTQASAAAIRSMQPALSLVDQAWGRPQASSSWLTPWAQSVPQPYLQ